MFDALLLKAQSSTALRGISALSFMRYFTKFLTLARLAIVARVLGPEQLGLFGLAILVISITEVFTETGVNIVLLKNPKKFTAYYDTAWVVSLVRGTLISLGILALTPFLTTFYDQSTLRTFLLVAATIPFFRGFINPAVVLFQQRLQFEKESAFRIFLQIIDLGLGLVLALWWQNGLGLLVGVLGAVITEVIASFLIFPERPRWQRAQWKKVIALYKESKFIIGNGIIHYLTENIDDFLIGKLLGFSALGLYQTAYKLASAATMDFASIIGQTLYPIYARMITKKESVRQLLFRSNLFMIGVFLLAAVPFLAGTEPLVRLILGPEWLATVPLVRILFLAGVFKAFITSWNPLSVLADNLYHHFVINIIMMVVLVVGITTFSARFELTGAALAILLAFAVVHPYAWFVLYQALGILRREEK